MISKLLSLAALFGLVLSAANSTPHRGIVADDAPPPMPGTYVPSSNPPISGTCMFHATFLQYCTNHDDHIPYRGPWAAFTEVEIPWIRAFDWTRGRMEILLKDNHVSYLGRVNDRPGQEKRVEGLQYDLEVSFRDTDVETVGDRQGRAVFKYGNCVWDENAGWPEWPFSACGWCERGAWTISDLICSKERKVISRVGWFDI